MKTSWRSASLVASAAAVLVLTTACGQDKADTSTGSQNVGAAPAANGYGTAGAAGASPGTETGAAATAGQGAAAQGQSAGQLAVADTDKLGEVVTDSAGMTLYRFDKDTAEPPKSTCEGDCATAWPPVPASGAAAPVGIDKALLGEVTRTDGTKQLTIDGWPQYRFAKDTKAGDVNGQGVGGTWYASAPTGKKASGGGGGGGGAAADLAGLSTRNDPELGEVVIDKNGMTVYRFEKDTPWPMKSACVGACLEKWPVVEPVDAADTKGIDNKNDGRRGYVVLNRPDGLKQQSIDCWPLYTFAGDKKPGDTNGQGVGGTWYAISPEGKPLGKPK
ncbi:SCO0930 family lipoprotein [Streptomyces sp. Qhu-G9]|uniref:SCO0930 family lipoprotein n=1 Tax=Streptomyces sp. Qhu-G9 TaxID=3452799 RepID=UPI0022AC209D|nr:SCO0930 family lipoprotein [Streptomyces aurantiacus]WAU83676.1 SCO0930 family lipoprotein [Streptomyces aurantiacus]